MYMNGRGPMMGGHRSAAGFGGRMHHPTGSRPMMGFVPGTGFRPMRVHRRPMGFFPAGSLFILPALMFGGWIAVTVLAGFLSLAGSIFEEAFTGEGVVIGIILGLAAFACFRNRIARKEECAGTVDDTEAETEIAEPVRYRAQSRD